MDNTTFREVSLTQSEAEAELEEPKPVGRTKSSSTGTDFNNTQIDEIVPPLEIYEVVKGRPYLIDYLELKDRWDFHKLEPDRSLKTFGNIPRKIGAVEAYVQRYMEKNFMDDSLGSTKTVLKILDKLVNYSRVSDPIEKLNRLYSFVVSSNKSRAFKNLRSALQRQSIDDLVDTNKIQPSQLSPFMRK